VIRAAPGPVLRLYDVVGHYGVGSFVGELPAGKVLPLTRSVRHQRRRTILLSPDEEDVRVEWSCRDDKLLPVLL
jgi:hypothetical protein